jgi:hypothetical protein
MTTPLLTTPLPQIFTSRTMKQTQRACSAADAAAVPTLLMVVTLLSIRYKFSQSRCINAPLTHSHRLVLRRRRRGRARWARWALPAAGPGSA